MYNVWMPEKMRKMCAPFESDPRVLLTFSDARAVDQELHPLGYNLWQSIGFDARMQRIAARQGLFSVLMRRNVVGGSCMAFRLQSARWTIPIPQIWPHDALDRPAARSLWPGRGGR